ncbi:hypothetical protein Bhyg_00497 [Pseudolycoriella hygida]|uniref:Uncharacterized protein n=1 Tax=Pseudolycoriella hygida TaxID=35572 RepID=A0A9Q0S5Z1_9DIPT|nr:hypothetical protein Bhyg_00497 [Pseudolycoriella hygida]
MDYSDRSFNMKNKVFIVLLLFLTSVYMMPSLEDDDDDLTDQEFQLVTEEPAIYTNDSNDKICEIGPRFSRKNFKALLKRDLKDAYRRKCKKISGDDSAFSDLMQGKIELTKCMNEWRDNNFNKLIETRGTDPGEFFTILCKERDGLFKCYNGLKAVKKPCSFPSEIERTDKILNFLKNIVDSMCVNEGSDLDSITSRKGAGRKCVETNMKEIKTCTNKALYAASKRLLLKFVENEHFEFKIDQEDCYEFDAVKDCFVQSVDKCEDQAAKTIITSLFNNVRYETECANLINHDELIIR